MPVVGANRRLRGMVCDCLAGGVARGDVRADVDIELAADLIIGAYAWNYRRGAAQTVDAVALTNLLDRQIGVIFDGLAPARG